MTAGVAAALGGGGPEVGGCPPVVRQGVLAAAATISAAAATAAPSSAAALQGGVGDVKLAIRAPLPGWRVVSRVRGRAAVAVVGRAALTGRRSSGGHVACT